MIAPSSRSRGELIPGVSIEAIGNEGTQGPGGEAEKELVRVAGGGGGGKVGGGGGGGGKEGGGEKVGGGGRGRGGEVYMKIGGAISGAGAGTLF